MRILCIVYFDTSKHTGHVAHARGILHALNRKGHEVHILAPGWDDPPSPSMTITRVWQWRRRGFYTMTYALAVLPKLLMLLLRDRPDVVYARYFNFLFPLALLTRLFRTPMVVEHNAETTTEHKMYRRGWFSRVFNDFAERALLAASDGSIAVTESIVRSWRSRPSLANVRAVVIRNGVDINIYKPLDRELCKAELGLDTSRRYICYVGAFSPAQGISYLLEAFRLLTDEFPNAGLVLVGAENNEADSPQFKDALREHAGRLVIVKAVPEAIAAKYICAGEVCIAPYTKSVALYETNTEAGAPMNRDPLKIYSYMACGRPVVASHFREAGEQLSKIGAGVPVAPEDPVSIKNALASLLRDPESAAAMGARGRAHAEIYCTWDFVAEQTLSFIELVKTRQ